MSTMMHLYPSWSFPASHNDKNNELAYCDSLPYIIHIYKRNLSIGDIMTPVSIGRTLRYKAPLALHHKKEFTFDNLEYNYNFILCTI